MKLQNSLKNFSNGDTALLVKFQDYFNHYHNREGKFDNSKTLNEKKTKLDMSMRETISKLANVPTVEGIAPEVLMSSPQYQWATFAVVGAMVDAVLPDALIDSIGMYTDIRFGGFGDSANFRISSRDLFVVSKGTMGNLASEIKKQYDGNVTIVPEFRDITVYTSLYRVLSGEEDMAEFAMKAARSLESQMTRDAFNAFNTAMAALPTTGAALKVAGWADTTALALAQKVSAWNGGKQAIFVGTKAALAKVLPTSDTNYRYFLESEYVKIGYIKEFKGFSVIELPQVADYTTEFGLALDDTKIYVLSPASDKLIKGFVEGSTVSLVSQYENNADLTQLTTMKKSYGFAVATSSIAGVIQLS